MDTMERLEAQTPPASPTRSDHDVCNLCNCTISRDVDQEEDSPREAEKSIIISSSEDDDEVYVTADECARHIVEVDDNDMGKLSTKSCVTRVHPSSITSINQKLMGEKEILENISQNVMQAKETLKSIDVKQQPDGVILPNDDADTDLTDRSRYYALKWDCHIFAAIEEVLGSRPITIADPHVVNPDETLLVENHVACDSEREMQYLTRGNILPPTYIGDPPRQGIVIRWDNSKGKGRISERYTDELRRIHWRQLRPYYGSLHTGVTIYYQWAEGEFVQPWVALGMPYVP